jgi:hypothetical protein
MLALEEVYDVTIVKDGQEAYDTVKLNMEKGEVFDLIFMDIQVMLSIHYMWRKLVNWYVDAHPRWSSEHSPYSADGILCPDCRAQCLCGRK